MKRVRVVLALGRIGWESWLRAAGWWERLGPRERPAFAHGAEAVLPDGKLLVTSFHPSRQNTNTGKLTRAMWHGVFERMQGDSPTLRPPRHPLHRPPRRDRRVGALQLVDDGQLLDRDRRRVLAVELLQRHLPRAA